MAEAYPSRKRGIGSESLVPRELTASEKLLASGRFELASQLTPDQWSVAHKQRIKHIVSQPDGSYNIILEDMSKISLERDDGLVVLPDAPRDTI